MTEGARYRRLADLALANGHHVTPYQIHHWVRDGLLPRTVDRESLGRGGFSSRPRRDAEKQLLALCALRQVTKSNAALVLLLWVDGWPIRPEHVRRALREWIPRPAERKLREAERDRISGLARKHARALRRELPPAGLTDDDSADLGEFLVRLVAGDRPEFSPSIEPILSRAMGLDRAASDALGGEKPWYDPAGGLAPLFDGVTLSELHVLVDEASQGDLAAARLPARLLIYDLPRIAEMAELAYGRGAGGLAHLRLLRPKRPELAVIVALRAVRSGLGPQLADLVKAVRQPPMREALELLAEGRAWVNGHPDRRRIARIGLHAYSQLEHTSPGATRGNDADS